MIFKIKNRNGAWDFTDKVDEVRFHPYGSYELFIKHEDDQNDHIGLRSIGGDPDSRHEIQFDDCSYVDVPELKSVIANGGVVRCKYITLLRRIGQKEGDRVTVAVGGCAFTTTAFLMSDDGKTVERL